MKNTKILIASLLMALMVGPSTVRAQGILETLGGGLTAVGNFFNAIFMFFFNLGFILSTSIMFIAFFAIEIGLVYIYWRIGSFVYNNLIPSVKKISEFLDNISE